MENTKSNLYELYKNANQDSINISFSRVCSKNNIERIKYLLTSPELSIHADINFKDDAIKSACYNGNLELVKYFLTSPELKKHANYQSAIRSSIQYGKVEILRYLLNPSNFELNEVREKIDGLFLSANFFGQKEIVKFFI